VLIGLLCQLVLLPVLGFVIASAFSLPPVYAISIILLAAAPGGATSNLIVHAADGDRALSVTLTAISNMLAWFMIPFLLGIAYTTYGSGALDIDFPVASTMIQVAALTVVPVLIGMGIRNWKPDFAENSKRWSKIFAGGFLFLVILALVIQNWDVIVNDGPRFAPAFITLNIAALAVGFIVARLAGINPCRRNHRHRNRHPKLHARHHRCIDHPQQQRDGSRPRLVRHLDVRHGLRARLLDDAQRPSRECRRGNSVKFQHQPQADGDNSPSAFMLN
jgi:ACR3 family arsenite efflux pump ArsB